MDYEKKYKEAFERAKLSRLQLLDIGEEATEIEYIFPELKESEDERIRKDIISYLQYESQVKRFVGDIEYDKWIAWLEKQGEPQPYKGNADTMRKNLIKAFKSVGSNHWGGFDVRDILHFLESKDAIELENQGEQKSMWSEEDGDLYTIANNFMPEPAWNAVIETKEEGSGAFAYDYNQMVNMFKAGANWLKSIRPHWKPTEEQMEDLKYAINMVDKCCEDSLQSLYNDLKKL